MRKPLTTTTGGPPMTQKTYDAVSANGVSGLELAQHLLRVLRWEDEGRPFDIQAPLQDDVEARALAILKSDHDITLPDTNSLGLLNSELVQRIDPLLHQAKPKHSDKASWRVCHIVTIILHPACAKTA